MRLKGDEVKCDGLEAALPDNATGWKRLRGLLALLSTDKSAAFSAPTWPKRNRHKGGGL
jgi:hypothetical protein